MTKCWDVQHRISYTEVYALFKRKFPVYEDNSEMNFIHNNHCDMRKQDSDVCRLQHNYIQAHEQQQYQHLVYRYSDDVVVANQ